MKAADQFGFRFGNIKRRTVAFGQWSNEKDNVCDDQVGGLKNITCKNATDLIHLQKTQKLDTAVGSNTLVYRYFIEIQSLCNHDNSNQGKTDRYFIRNHLGDSPHGAQ